MKALRCAAGAIEPEQLRDFWELWNRIWPNKEGKDAATLAQAYWESAIASGEGAAEGLVFHWAEVHGQLIALARSFQREIRFEASGRSCPVLALAGVCCAPERRASGWGRTVVEDAFQRMREEPERFALCLFQTGVPGFYEKLGCRVVANDFVNRRAEPDANPWPWWDDWVMIHPADAIEWEDGRVDMQGPGY